MPDKSNNQLLSSPLSCSRYCSICLRSSSSSTSFCTVWNTSKTEQKKTLINKSLLEAPSSHFQPVPISHPLVQTKLYQPQPQPLLLALHHPQAELSRLSFPLVSRPVLERSECPWHTIKGQTFVISMLISRIVWLICGNFTRVFESFIISVDFCSDPVTLTIAVSVLSISRHCIIIVSRPTHLLGQLHFNWPQPRFTHVQPILLLVTPDHFFRQYFCTFRIPLCGELL